MTRLFLIGFGAVHQHLAHILLEKADHLAQVFDFHPRVVGVADSRGATWQPGGLDLAALLAHKQAGHSVVTFPGGEAVDQGAGALDSTKLSSAIQPLVYDLLLDASPVNLTQGEPGLSCVRTALSQGKSVVLANKAPLVLDYAGLHHLAQQHGVRMAFSATVCGGLPVVNVGQRDLVGATIHKIEGIFNSTTNYILSRVAAGESYADALAEAQRRGIAEADPRLDVEGWDTANKLVIIANAILGYPARLGDVAVTGVTGLMEQMGKRRRDSIYKLVARAERQPNGGYTLSVGPELRPAADFLAGVSEWQMAIVFYTDLYEEIYLKIDEKGPKATAAAMLRDCIDLIA